MSQMMVGIRETRLIHDMCLQPAGRRVPTGAAPAVCGTCGRGIYDGYSVVATVSGGRVRLFCEMHAPQ